MSLRWAVLLTCIVAADASGQGLAGGALVGRVVDASGAAVPDAAISASAAELSGGTRTTTSQSDGRYRLAGLPGGTYRVEAGRPGFKTVVVQDVYLRAGTTAVIDVVLDISDIAEQIAVNGTAPIDVRSAAPSWSLDGSLIRNLPTTHSLFGLLNLAPGVTQDAAFGGSRLGNEVRIAGLNLSNTWSLQPWVATDYNWLASVRLVALGAGAEYGGFGGALLDAQLKAGGNEPRGYGEFRLTRRSWMDSNVGALNGTGAVIQNPPQRTLDWYDASADGGGPLHRDRLWLFTGYEQSRNHFQPALYTGDGSIDVTDRRLVLRLDAAAAAVSGGATYSYAVNRATGLGLSGFTPLEATSTDTQDDHAAKVFLTIARQSTLVDVSGRAVRSFLSSDPTAPATRAGPYPRFDLVRQQASGNVGYFADLASNRTEVAATFRTVAGRFLSAAAGVEVEQAGSRFLQGYPGGRYYYDENGVPATVFLREPDRTNSDMTRVSSFASGELLVRDSLTVSPGLRVTFNRGSIAGGPPLVSNTSVDPRLGLAWDVTRGHTTVLRGHVGRFHDSLLTNQFSYLDPQYSPEITAAVDGAGELVEISRTTATQFAVDPDLRQAFFDQVVAGMERQLGRSWTAAVDYVWRRYAAITAFIDTGSVYQPIDVVDPGPDGRRGTPDDGGLLRVFRKTNRGSERFYYTNPTDAYRRYDAVQVTASNRLVHGLQLQGSYVWSRTRGNVENGDFSNSTGPDVGINGVFSDPNRSILSDGPSTFDFTHDAKVMGVYRLPWVGGMVSGIYRYQSGLAWGRATQVPELTRNFQNVTFGIRVEPRGARRTAALSNLDLRVEKVVSFGSHRAGVYADVFNVTNQGIPDPAYRRAVMHLSGPSFGQPQFWRTPRQLQVGFRVNF